jgi:glutathione peroxidase
MGKESRAYSYPLGDNGILDIQIIDQGENRAVTIVSPDSSVDDDVMSDDAFQSQHLHHYNKRQSDFGLYLPASPRASSKTALCELEKEHQKMLRRGQQKLAMRSAGDELCGEEEEQLDDDDDDDDDDACCDKKKPKKCGVKVVCCPGKTVRCFHELSATTLSGCKKTFKEFKGKVTLIVNTATMAENGKEELQELNCLVEEICGDNFALLAFPSNTFGNEPADSKDILNMMSCVRPGCNFKPKFEMFCKADVNGEDESPVFKFLKKKLPVPQDCALWLAGTCSEVRWTPILRTDIGGDFERFIVNHRGCPCYRFTSRKPLKEIKCILKELVMDAACEKRASKKQSCCPSTSILGSCPKEPACPPPPPPCPPKPCPPKPDCEKYFDRLYPAPTKRSFGYGKHEVGRGRTREVQPLGPDVDSMNKDRSRTRGHQLGRINVIISRRDDVAQADDECTCRELYRRFPNDAKADRRYDGNEDEARVSAKKRKLELEAAKLGTALLFDDDQRPRQDETAERRRRLTKRQQKTRYDGQQAVPRYSVGKKGC